MKHRILPSLLALSAVFAFSACDDDDKKPLEGKRISVLASAGSIASDTALASMPVTVPAPEANASWPLQQTAPDANLALPGGGKGAPVTVSAVDGGDNLQLSSAPVVAGGLVYTLGASGDISARQAGNIRQEAWKYSIPASKAGKDRDFLGGNIATGDGLLVATTWRGQVVALDAATGNAGWQRTLELPIRSAPVIKGGRIYFVTADNRLYALSAKDGKTLWTHEGIAQTTSMFGASSPAANDEFVVVLYSSGEIHALDAHSGQVKWSDVIEDRNHSRLSGSSLSGATTPLIVGSRVYAATYDGNFAAFDLASGHHLWAQAIASLYPPVAAGEFLFVLSTDDEVACLHATDGKIRWTAALPARTAASSSWFGSSKGEQILWSGPVLAGSRLFVTGSHGQMEVFSPEKGAIETALSIPDQVLLPPVVAGGVMYMLSNEGTLAAVK